MRSSSFRLLAIAAVAVTSMIGAQVASAKVKPSVTWTSSRSASVGSPISVSWTSKHLPKGAKLVVQKPVGTAKVYKTVIKLGGASGTAQLPAQAGLGKYKYRLTALEGKSIIAKQAVVIGVFGQVPLSTLLPEENAAHSGVYAAPAASFPYVGGVLGNTDNFKSTAAFSVKNNNCSEAHIDFITGGEAAFSFQREFLERTTGTLTIVQEQAEPVSSTSPFNSPSSVTTKLVPGQTWSVLASGGVSSPNGENAFITVYYDGYAVCDSAEPF